MPFYRIEIVTTAPDDAALKELYPQAKVLEVNRFGEYETVMGVCEPCGALCLENQNYQVGPEGDYFCAGCAEAVIKEEK